MEASMKATSLKSALSGTMLLALLGGSAILPVPASAADQHLYLGDGAPATLEQVRRRIFVAPAYGYDPYYYGPDYYAAPVAPYAPPVAYAPPPAYDYLPPVDYDYVPAPGPGVAGVAPETDIDIGY
jgi:hypothetical protein